MSRVAISTVLVLTACGCRESTPKDTAATTHVVVAPADANTMQHEDDMQAIRNDQIKVATMRPPGSTMPTRDRQVKVIAPPEAVALSHRGELSVLDELIPLLADPARAWAAEAILAAMTGHEADLVNDYQASPETFFPEMGAGAKQRWQKWLDEVRGQLQWDVTRMQFVAR